MSTPSTHPGHNAEPREISRRSILSLAVMAGAIAGLGIPSLAPLAAAASTAVARTGGLERIGNTSGAKRIFTNAFPVTSVRQVVALPGTGTSANPWMAVSITGPLNQLQIIDSATAGLKWAITVVDGSDGGLGDLLWDQKSAKLYVVNKNELLTWSAAAPTKLTPVATIPGATAIYRLNRDSAGNIWGGTYPLGATFKFNPATGQVDVHTRLAADTDYVRSLTIGSDDTVWAGTGAKNPRVYTFKTATPQSRTAIQVPVETAMANGFITRMDARGNRVYVGIESTPEPLVLNASTRQWGPLGGRKLDSRLISGAPGDEYFYSITGGRLYRTHTGTWAENDLGPAGTSTPMLLHASGTAVIVVAKTADGLTLATFDTSTGILGAPKLAALREGTFKIQSLMAHSDGTVYLGGYQGHGMASINPDTGARWKTPADMALINQIEGMIEFSPAMSYIGSYGSADIVSMSSSDKNAKTGYKRLERLLTKYNQSRPFGWAKNSKNVFFGTVPNYGSAGGAIGMINPETNTISWVDNGGGEGFVKGHSIIGLTADEKYLYGTTSTRSGYGEADAPGDPKVFKYDIAARTKVWETAPVPGARALYAPQLVEDVLVVADLEGINLIDPATGKAIRRHRLTELRNKNYRAGWAASDMVSIPGTSRLVHTAAGTTTLVDLDAGTYSRIGDKTGPNAFGSRLAVSPSGRVFSHVNDTALAELDLTPLRGPVRSRADLVTITVAGALQTRASDGRGKWAAPATISTGWKTAEILSFHMVDWYNTGRLDLLVQYANGRLDLHRATASGFDAAKQVGTGWGSYDISVGQIDEGSAHPCVLAKDSTGTVWSYPVQPGGALSSSERKQVAKVPATNQVRLLDMDADGKPGILCRQGAAMNYLAGLGTGLFSTTVTSVATAGWSSAKTLSPVQGHYNGLHGLVYRLADGSIRYISARGTVLSGIITPGLNLAGQLIAGSRAF